MSVSSITEAGQYLTFKLEHEVFALDIGKVREVLDFTSIAKLPQTPDFMLGVINRRTHGMGFQRTLYYRDRALMTGF
jgi:purine-binding chemotaxis protein CheW